MCCSNCRVSWVSRGSFSEGGSTHGLPALLQADLVDHLGGVLAGVVMAAEGLPSHLASPAMGFLRGWQQAPRFDLVWDGRCGAGCDDRWVRTRDLGFLAPPQMGFAAKRCVWQL